MFLNLGQYTDDIDLTRDEVTFSENTEAPRYEREAKAQPANRFGAVRCAVHLHNTSA